MHRVNHLFRFPIKEAQAKRGLVNDSPIIRNSEIHWWRRVEAERESTGNS
jgi:hypothetical protein